MYIGITRIVESIKYNLYRLYDEDHSIYETFTDHTECFRGNTGYNLYDI